MVMRMLEQEFKLKCGYILPNRLCKAALTEHLADKSGNLNQMHYNLYQKWANSGACVILTGNVMIDRDDQEGEGNVVIDSPTQIESLCKWVHAGGNQLWLQIGHAGALSNSNRPLSPSGVPYSGRNRSFPIPHVMNKNDILELKERYRIAAGLAKEAGFAGIEIHSAHGFLLNSFLSARTNYRTDEYGGSLENRVRLLSEVLDTCRAEVGSNYPIAVKINTKDNPQEDITSERIQICKIIDEIGVDILELSGGNYDYTPMLGEETPRNYFLDFARKVKKAGIKSALMITGGLRDVPDMEIILQRNDADLIGLGRPMIINPRLPVQILEGKVSRIPEQESDTLPVIEQLTWYWKRIKELAK